MKNTLIVLAVLTLVPLVEADTLVCNAAACIETVAYDYGTGECGDAGTSHVHHRGASAAVAPSIVNVGVDAATECHRFSQNGEDHGQNWTHVNVVLETPVGDYGPLVAWGTTWSENETASQEECSMWVSQVGVLRCPGDALPSYIGTLESCMLDACTSDTHTPAVSTPQKCVPALYVTACVASLPLFPSLMVPALCRTAFEEQVCWQVHPFLS
jgi:hypothetical protein